MEEKPHLSIQRAWTVPETEGVSVAWAKAVLSLGTTWLSESHFRDLQTLVCQVRHRCLTYCLESVNCSHVALKWVMLLLC